MGHPRVVESSCPQRRASPSSTRAPGFPGGRHNNTRHSYSGHSNCIQSPRSSLRQLRSRHTRLSPVDHAACIETRTSSYNRYDSCTLVPPNSTNVSLLQLFHCSRPCRRRRLVIPPLLCHHHLSCTPCLRLNHPQSLCPLRLPIHLITPTFPAHPSIAYRPL